LLVDEGDLEEEFTPDEIKDRIILGDCRSVLPRIPDGSFEMIFLDPPYHLRMGSHHLNRWNSGTDARRDADEWDRFSSPLEYEDFIRDIVTESKRILKENGSIWLSGTYHSIFTTGKILQESGLWILNDIIWIKSNPMPNWRRSRFTNATETLIWAVKGSEIKDYTFREERAREFGIGRIGSNVWVLPAAMGKERVKDTRGKALHSAQKPLELMKRIVLTSTEMGDLILDPMSGVGTTGYAARRYKRNFVMIEKNRDFAEASERRLKERKNPKRGDNNPYPELEELRLGS
jgi:DNA modification methylase